jgi:hypothetical protein
MRPVRPARIICAVLLLAVAAGCAPARRPEQQRQPGSPPPITTGSSLEAGPKGRGSKAYPTPRAGSAYDDPSMGVSTIASAVPGAGSVEAVVLGNVVLVGIASQDGRIHRKVAEQIHASFPHIVEVRLTTDPAATARLRTVRQQINLQHTIAPFLPELANLSAGMRNAP